MLRGLMAILLVIGVMDLRAMATSRQPSPPNAYCAAAWPVARGLGARSSSAPLLQIARALIG
jgi:hypothetical protein